VRLWPQDILRATESYAWFIVSELLGQINDGQQAAMSVYDIERLVLLPCTAKTQLRVYLYFHYPFL